MERKQIVGIAILILVLSAICAVLCILGFIKWRVGKILDKSENSETIQSPLPNTAYPYVGIWKSKPRNPFGVIIEKAGAGMYSVSFFGPGGRFKPGTWRPNTKIAGDPNYRIIDKDRIVIGTDTYYRMPD